MSPVFTRLFHRCDTKFLSVGVSKSLTRAAGDELATIVEHFIKAKAHNASLPDILPRVIAIAKTLPDANNKSVAVKKVVVAYATQGQYDRAIKLIQQFEEDFDREDGAQEVAIQFAKLGLYDRAVQLANKAGDYFGLIALVGIAAEALKRRDKAKALEIAGRADFLIAKANNDEDYEPTGDILKNFALAFAEAGNIRAALQQVPKIQEPYFITHALIEIGMLCAKKKLPFNEGDLAVLNEIVKADLPADIQPEKLVSNAGWEIPGLAQSRMLRPPELQRTRDRSIQLYFTYYEPEVATFIKRPFPSRRKPEPEEADWVSEGLKVRLIEERVISGHKFCYKLDVEEMFHDKVTGFPKYTNYSETLLYYDEDGDGKFETLEEGLDYFARGHIPKWVLEK